MDPTMTPRLLTLLAQAGTGSALIGTLILIVALILMFGAVAAYRKWMRADTTPSGPGFTLSDLRKLHKEGKMTDEEFEKAKLVLIGTAKVGADKPVLGERQGPRTDPPGFDVLPPGNE
jgi:hypothetical protein